LLVVLENTFAMHGPMNVKCKNQSHYESIEARNATYCYFWQEK